MIPLTAPEVRRLMLMLALPAEERSFRLRWSKWRRRRQADARRCHYRRWKERDVSSDEVRL